MFTLRINQSQQGTTHTYYKKSPDLETESGCAAQAAASMAAMLRRWGHTEPPIHCKGSHRP